MQDEDGLDYDDGLDADGMSRLMCASTAAGPSNGSITCAPPGRSAGNPRQEIARRSGATAVPTRSGTRLASHEDQQFEGAIGQRRCASQK
jgi:hypothetical protein